MFSMPHGYDHTWSNWAHILKYRLYYFEMPFNKYKKLHLYLYKQLPVVGSELPNSSMATKTGESSVHE